MQSFASLRLRIVAKVEALKPVVAVFEEPDSGLLDAFRAMGYST